MLSRGKRLILIPLLSVLLALGTPAAAGAVTIDTFPIDPSSEEAHRPLYIASSPLGTLWFTEYRVAVREINTAGALLATVTTMNGGQNATPYGDLVFGPDGSVYWARSSGYGVRRPNGQLETHTETVGGSNTVGFNTAGAIAFGAEIIQSPSPRRFGPCASTCRLVALSSLSDIVTGAGGSTWVIAPESNEVTRIEEGGFSGLVVTLPVGSSPQRAAMGPDGNLWVTAPGGGGETPNQIIRVSPDGVQTSFPLPPQTVPWDIVLGPDGALWFTEFGAGAIGRMTTNGEYSSCSLPNAAANPGPYGITVGSEGAIWFAERNAGAIGRLRGGNCAPVPPGGGGSSSGGNSGGGSAGAGAQTQAGGSIATKPTLTGLRLAPANFAAASSGGPVPPAKQGVGTKVSFQASAPGEVRFAVKRTTNGRRSGGRCAAATKANAGKPPCSRFVAVRGGFVVAAAAGQNSTRFSGRISGKALDAGRYVLVATETAGGLASAPASAGFRIHSP